MKDKERQGKAINLQKKNGAPELEEVINTKTPPTSN